MINTNARIGIIGAGTTGVFLASLLHQKGYQIDLFESANIPRTNGCGIFLVQDGIKALFEGNQSVCQKIIKAGSTVNYFEFRNLKGGIVNQHFVNYQKDELPAILVHRQAILEALLSTLPNNFLHLNHRFISLSQTAEKITAYFANGEQWEGDLLIGADGIFSRVRSFILPQEKHLFYLGDIVWRGVVNDDSFCPEGHFIVYVRGRGIYANFFSLGNGKTHWGFFVEKGQNLGEQNKPRPHDILIPKNQLIKLPNEARQIIQNTPLEDIFCNFSYDINTLPYLYDNRVILIGDAGHASSSTKARGMTSGFEDALALAHHFDQCDSIDQLLFNFQKERLPIVHEYQISSRKMSLNIGRKQRQKAA